MRIYISIALAIGALTAGAVNPTHNRVIDYVPAPGQFVNMLPEYEAGDNAADMAKKALTATTEDESIISLGAFGGYVTFGFPTTIVNAEGKRDIYIQGNSFNPDDGSGTGASSEPGIVMVAYDINGNGIPDDNEWFEIAGSEYRYSTHNYEITYTKPATNKDAIKWKDNQGGSGEIAKLIYHKQPYWPQWLTGNELTFIGTRLPNNAVNAGTAENPYYVLKSYEYGYADNKPNYDASGNYNEGAKIDIDWAVDKNGNPVKMPGVDFVRIYTGLNQFNGWIGESSCEIGKVMNAHIKKVGTDEVVDESIKIDENVLRDFLAKYGDGGIGEISNNNIRVTVDANGIISFIGNSDALVSICDATGRCRYNAIHPAGKNEISISNFEPGLYIIVIDGKTIKIAKK